MPVLNVCLRKWGKIPWLFDDIASMMGEECLWPPGWEVRVTEDPLTRADRWLFIRTEEAASSPDFTRTTVQVHDLYNDDYGVCKKRFCVSACNQVQTVHPYQREILEAVGVQPRRIRHTGPIGARESFTHCCTQRVSPFTIGWVGRPVTYRGVDVKRLGDVIEAVNKVERPCRFLTMGMGITPYLERLGSHVTSDHYERAATRPGFSIVSYPDRYRQMDVLVTFSRSEAGPMCLFEALACGVPVISSKTGHFWLADFLVDSVDDLASSLNSNWSEQTFEDKRCRASRMHRRTMERWVITSLDLAAGP